MPRKWIAHRLLVLPLAVAGACMPKTVSPASSALICFHAESDLAAVGNELRAIASSVGMKVTDRSAEASAELNHLKELVANPPDWYSEPLLMMTVEREDGMGLTATNAGLRNAVALTISGGEDQSDAQAFAVIVLSRFRAKWDVRELPSNGGTYSSSDCTDP